MLTVRVFSQHLVSLFKTIRPVIVWGAQCVGHRTMVWSVASHLQCEDGARPHLGIDEQKCPMQEHRRLSLIHNALGKPIDLRLTLGMKTWIVDILTLRVLHFPFRVRPLLCADAHVR